MTKYYAIVVRDTPDAPWTHDISFSNRDEAEFELSEDQDAGHLHAVRLVTYECERNDQDIEIIQSILDALPM